MRDEEKRPAMGGSRFPASVGTIRREEEQILKKDDRLRKDELRV
jgi:hypothetical protein